MALAPGETVVCLGCGESMAPRAGLAVCSHRCRKRELRARRRRERRQICAGCRHDFTPARSDARYCTDACRFKAYRRRLAARAAEAERAARRQAEAAERAREAHRRAVDLACRLIG